MIRNILSISHNKAMNYLIRTVLGNTYNLTIVEDVFQGMNLLKHKQNINLIIVDIDYHTKESIDFIMHIDSSKLYNKPVIVLSSAQNQKINASVIESNSYNFFIKPFNPIDLQNSIKRLILSTSLS